MQLSYLSNSVLAAFVIILFKERVINLCNSLVYR